MQEKRKNPSPYHPDIPLFLILIPFISAFNYYLTYANIQLNWFLVLTFTIDTIQGYIAWWILRAFVLYLDKKLPYEKGMTRRIIIQLLGIFFIGLAIIGGLTELVSWLARGRSAPLSFYTEDLIIISIWFFVINGIYVGLHFYKEWQKTETRLKEEYRIKAEGLRVTQGKKELRLAFERIAGFYVDGNYVMTCDLQGQKYFLDKSLDKIENILPAGFFFRLNRQFLLHRQIIAGFKRAENGKIQVLLKDQENFPSEISVSRTKAPGFKDWFQRD